MRESFFKSRRPELNFLKVSSVLCQGFGQSLSQISRETTSNRVWPFVDEEVKKSMFA